MKLNLFVAREVAFQLFQLLATPSLASLSNYFEIVELKFYETFNFSKSRFTLFENSQMQARRLF